jgi:hypothetical protein
MLYTIIDAIIEPAISAEQKNSLANWLDVWAMQDRTKITFFIHDADEEEICNDQVTEGSGCNQDSEAK